MKLVETFEVTKSIVAELEMAISPISVKDNKAILIGCLGHAKELKQLDFVETVGYNRDRNLISVELADGFEFHQITNSLFIIKEDIEMVSAKIVR